MTSAFIKSFKGFGSESRSFRGRWIAKLNFTSSSLSALAFPRSSFARPTLPPSPPSPPFPLSSSAAYLLYPLCFLLSGSRRFLSSALFLPLHPPPALCFLGNWIVASNSVRDREKEADHQHSFVSSTLSSALSKLSCPEFSQFPLLLPLRLDHPPILICSKTARTWTCPYSGRVHYPL